MPLTLPSNKTRIFRAPVFRADVGDETIGCRSVRMNLLQGYEPSYQIVSDNP